MRSLRLLAYFVLPATLVACAPPAPPALPPPNVVLITLDTTRTDALGVYGGGGSHTRRIDAWAERSVVFERAIAPVGTTYPSHASMFTGLYPRRHGLGSNQGRLDESFDTLAELLAEDGYETAAWVSFRSMLSRGGFAQGFAESSVTAAGAPPGLPGPGREVNELALPWLRREREKPFFAWIHYFDAHSPYDVTLWARKALAGYAGTLKDGVLPAKLTMLGKEVPWNDADREALRTIYTGKVRVLDRLVGEVLDSLRDAGVEENTVVVLTADHGQVLGEHEDLGHAFLLWEEVIHVPLIIRDPRRRNPPNRVAARVGLVDLTPTILELAGVPVPEGLDGRSLVPLLQGGETDVEDRLYYAEVQARGRFRKSKADLAAVAIYRDRWKSIWSEGRLETYDLSRDPGEAAPVLDAAAPEDTAVVHQLARRYYEGARQGPQTELTPEVRAELRALGYLE